ncbi:putative phosphatidylethanolamine-binding protein [Aspergillus campestris IBT 28561]|uniref:Phosphatidylethanolamine-binding protein n=1 Tax=Aspergillus campestris (strain IBT 28561) TaxID=1392248 RepID=A0A2I1DCQ6_ASPC2|nr:putative phosphatidylethanolamine-binding protein [Aspergillus campestris IBT 28561]PKY07668.1 putative phosphatidylethanolamine-binding protein [Aspergillus campestris IBT 28561]
MSLTSFHQELSASLLQAGLLEKSAPLIPPQFTPATRLDVSFDSKAVHLGNVFRARECKLPPVVSFGPEEHAPSRHYTLLLVDPDAPTPEDPKFAYWRHWVVSGLQPSPADNKSSTVLTEYLGPGPKDESNPHRYLFLLFREPTAFAPRKEDVGGEEFVQRRSFPAAKWVEEHGLELVAVNWMQGVGDGWSG